MKLFEKTVSIFLAAAFVAAFLIFPAFADDLEYGDFTYKYDGETIAITNYTGFERDIVFPSVIEGRPVTKILSAFGSTDIDSVTFPDSITTIEASAFMGSEVENVRLSNNLTLINNKTFANCKNIKRIEIPSSVEMINKQAFSGCSSLDQIVISEGVATIENKAFANCTALKSIFIPRSVTSIHSDAFYGSGLATVYGYSGSAAETHESSVKFSFIPIAKLNGKQLVLGTDISVRLYAYLSDAEADAVMRVAMNGKSVEINGVPTGADPYEYMFVYNGVAPQCIGDEITAELVLGEDVLDNTYESFSVLSYCKEVLELLDGTPEYAKTCTLIADLMEYGAKAQLYKNHKTDALVTSDETIAGLTKTDYIAPDETAAYTLTPSTDAENVRIRSANVHFSFDNKLAFKFLAKGVDGDFCVKVTSPDGDVKYYALDDCTLVDADTYILYTDSITAPKLSRGADGYFWHTVELKKSADGETIQQLTYSIASYVYAMKDGGGAMAELAKALYTYGRSAYAYLCT